MFGFSYYCDLLPPFNKSVIEQKHENYKKEDGNNSKRDNGWSFCVVLVVEQQKLVRVELCINNLPSIVVSIVLSNLQMCSTYRHPRLLLLLPTS